MARPRKESKQSTNLKVDVLSEKDFKGLLNSIRKSSKDIKELIQQAAYQAILMAYSNDNYDRATAIYYTVEESLSSSQAIQLRRYFELFGPFAWRTTKEGKKFRKSKAANANEFDLENAYSTYWFEIAIPAGESEEETPRLFSLTKVTNRLARLVNDLNAALEEHKLEHGEEEEELRELLSELSDILAEHKPAEEQEKKAA